MHAATRVDDADRDFPGVEDRATSGESSIRLEPFTVNVDGLVAALEGHSAWGQYSARQEVYAHAGMTDIWVRFNAWKNFDESSPAALAAFNNEHESVWYPICHEIIELQLAVYDVLDHLGHEVELGGVLITKMPPGASIGPHVDGGWHAGYYRDKYALQLKGALGQSFNFEGASLSALPGQVYWFDNSKMHWVENQSSEERMTMIICTRRKG